MKFERLADKITQVRGISFNPIDISDSLLPDYVPILKANNITERGLDISNLIYIHKSKVRPEQFIKKGDLLLAASSGSKDIVGKNIFFENDFEGSFGAFCKLIRPNEKINHNFLGVFFKTPVYKRHIRKLIQGALINNLRNEYIDSLPIPSLSFSEQIQIANILNKAETLIEQRKQSITLLDEFLKNTFLEFFKNPLLNKKGWEKISIMNAGKVVTGTTPSSKKEGMFGGCIPFVTPGDLESDAPNKRYLTDEGAKNSRTVRKGAVFICCIGATIGKVQRAKEFSAFNQQLNAIEWNSDFNDLFGEMLMRFMKPLIISKGGGSTTLPILNKGDFEKLEIIKPPLELQTQFANMVTKIETLKEQYKSSLLELENLYGSLSQRAFKGELSETRGMRKEKLIEMNDPAASSGELTPKRD